MRRHKESGPVPDQQAVGRSTADEIEICVVERDVRDYAAKYGVVGSLNKAAAADLTAGANQNLRYNAARQNIEHAPIGH